MIRATAALLGLAVLVSAQPAPDGVYVGPPLFPTGTGGADHKIVNSFPNPQGTNYASGLAYKDGVLWAASAFVNIIHRCDAITGTPISTLPAPTSNMRGLSHDGTYLWAASWTNRTVYSMDPLTGAVISSFVAPWSGGNPDGVAYDGQNLILSDEINNLRWVTTTGALIRTVPVPPVSSFNPRDLGWDGVFVYAGYQSAGRLKRHDANSGAVLLDIPAPSGAFQQGVEWAAWHLWTTGGTNATVYQIDLDPPYLNLVGTPGYPNSIQFRLTDAQSESGDLAIVVLSATGTSGFNVGGTVIPITFDGVTLLTLALLPNFSATVSALGEALTPPFGMPPIPAGIPFWAACATLQGSTFTSVADPIRFVSQ